MFELLFKYSRATFDRGEFVFASGWPLWLLALLVILGAIVLGATLVWYRRGLGAGRLIVLGVLQAGLWAAALFMLWRPSLLTQTLRPQQNSVAILLDRSESMAYGDQRGARLQVGAAAIESEIIPSLEGSLSIDLYSFSDSPAPLTSLDGLVASGSVTRLGDSLLNVLRGANAGGLAAVVLVSDGVDNSQTFDTAAIAEIAGYGVPVHTVGVGREVLEEDVELEDVIIAAEGPAGSTAGAQVSIRHGGGGLAELKVYDGEAILASQTITLPNRAGVITRQIDLDIGEAGVRDLRFTIDALPDERNVLNNTQLRPVEVPELRRSVLYIEGEPRWEYKFIRRALDENAPLRLASMLRTTPNKHYRQGIAVPDELADGFPVDQETLFEYDALIIGSYEAAALSEAQHEMIREFVSRRGGSLLMLGGRRGLADGGWGVTSVAEILPVELPDLDAPSFVRMPAKAALTEAGERALLTRFAAEDDVNRAAWDSLPELADFQFLGAVKPAADVLLNAEIANSDPQPLLVHQRYGLGNVYVLATGGTWRWQMQMPYEDEHHEIFWRQMLQALVTRAAQRITLRSDRAFYADEQTVELRAELKNAAFDADITSKVTVRAVHASGAAETVEMLPVPGQPGVYAANYEAAVPGIYRFEATAAQPDGEPIASSARVAVRREDGVAEHFQLQQNRALLERIAAASGGRYFSVDELDGLAEAISFSEAGVVERQLLALWNMPVLFLLLALLKAGEWLLRLRWGRL
ncbi:MAG: glutamine amidotransferase [Gammaproteobacteria bacterium]